jgi:aspartate racemase
MKTIGMIGGMSWESSIEYYRILNETVKDRLGGLHSARSVMYSVDFAEIEIMQSEGRWEQATQVMVEAARHVEAGGADFLIICTNTMHKMANAVEAAIHIPLLHIADATARAVKTQGFSKIALLGTKFTMEEDFYRLRLAKKYGLEVLIPDMEDREIIHSVIYDELVLGDIKPESREKYKRIIGKLIAAGAQGIILGCTEIGLLVKQDDSRVPLFDTTYIHATSAVELALE